MSSDERIETSFIPSGVSSAIVSLGKAYSAYQSAESEAHKVLQYSSFNTISIKGVGQLATKIVEIVYSFGSEIDALGGDADRFRRY